MLPVTVTASPIDPADRFDQELAATPRIASAPPRTTSADQARAIHLRQVRGVGPHMDGLTDTEHAALIGHLADIDQAIARIDHQTDTPADWPFTVDDPDRPFLSDLAIATLQKIRRAWITRAEAYTAVRAGTHAR